MNDKTNVENNVAGNVPAENDIKSEIYELRARLDKLCAALCEQETKSAASDDFLIAGNSLIKYKGNGGRAVIPYGVKQICADAFRNSVVKDVIIPSSVKIIGRHAFFSCKQLTRVDIPDGVEEIGEETFYSCDSLELVTIPASVSKLGRHAFASCSGGLTVCCEVKEKPAGWADEWDYLIYYINRAEVFYVNTVWGYKD